MSSKKGRWEPGESGNPNGRPPGSGKAAELRAKVAAHVPEILQMLVTQAKGGDVAAARLLLERVLPPVKSVDAAEPIALPSGTLAEQGRAVVQAMACGDISATAGGALMGALQTLARVVEVDELAARIEALEKAHAK